MKRLCRIQVIILIFLMLHFQKSFGQELPQPIAEKTSPQVAIPLRPLDSKPAPKPSSRPRYRRYSKDETLHYDADFKEVFPKPNSQKAELFFEVTNPSDKPVTITQIRPSCGCTLAKSPKLPWKIAPGEGDRITLSTSLKGKRGILSKSVSIFSSAGKKYLTFKVHLPDAPNWAKRTMTDGERLKNMQIAAKDRQAIFKGKCKACHYDAALNKKGEALFVAACGICHETPNRATMVPDLSIAKTAKRGEAYWHLWITYGKAGTLMPAFHKQAGGPLSSEQIKDLSTYLPKRFLDEINAKSKKISVPLDQKLR